MLQQFVRVLLESGNCRVPYGDFCKCDSMQLAETQDLVGQLEPDYRLSLPAKFPAFSVKNATAAAVFLYYVSQFVLKRELDDACTNQILDDTTSDFFAVSDSESSIYSIDFVLRFLPDLYVITKKKSDADVLLNYLVKVACRWPLSSVGMGALASGEDFLNRWYGLEEIKKSSFLSRMYIDRIVAKQDITRIEVPWVKELLIAEMGIHIGLAGQVGQLIESQLKSEKDSSQDA